MAAVLIVDDDEDTRAVIHMALADEGHQVSEAGDSESALAVLRQATGPQVVMVDEHLPGTSGAQLLRLIAADPALRGAHVFILMSADTRAATQLQDDADIRAIISATMLKPFDLYQMIALVHDLDDGHDSSGGAVGGDTAP